MKKLIILLIICSIALSQTASKDKVNPKDIQWPENLPFNIYSGYLDIYNNGSILSHYVFLTSMSENPSSDPVVLWLNGGPGCSSLLGLMQEIGPYLLLGYNSTLQNNTQFAWNRNVNLLFLESPPGVGYSINNITGYNYSDEHTAETNFLSLQTWYKRFIGYSQNKFWISGESYAGMYIPFLAEKIRVNNLNPRESTIKLNIQGFLIGNGAFILDWDMIGTYQLNTYFTHQFFNDHERIQYYKYCFGQPQSIKCKEIQETINNVVANTDHYSIYSYNYGYVKPTNSLEGKSEQFKEKSQQAKHLIRHLRSLRNVDEGYQNIQGDNAQPTTPDGIMQAYFNQIQVQKGFNVYETLQKYNPKFKWTVCNDYIGSNFNSANDSTHVYPQLLEAGYQILIYSGNSDAAVPFTYSQYCINDLIHNFNVSLSTIQDWTIWDPLPSKQLGGWYTKWRNNFLLTPETPQNYFTFAIVRAAGHEVPMYQHEAAYHMFQNFINGKTL